MTQIKIEATILVPDKPEGLDISEQAWGQILKNLWIHYHQSFADFTNKMFEPVGQTAGLDTSTELPSAELLTGKRRRKRQEKNGAYVTCKWLGDKTGYSQNTIRKMFLREKTGIDKRTFSGRNRKVYTVLRISKVAAKRRFPDLDV
jgi:hypothetical protein